MSAFPYAAVALVAAFASQSAAAACYLVYAPNQEIVYRAPSPPVDMSREIHETLPRVAPGATLVLVVTGTIKSFGTVRNTQPTHQTTTTIN